MPEPSSSSRATVVMPGAPGEKPGEGDWAGALWLAPDFAILHAQAGPTSAHAHYAHQWLLSEAGPISVDIEGIVHCAARIFVGSQRRHAVLAAAGTLWTVFAEPGSLSALALQESIAGAPLTSAALCEVVRAQRGAGHTDARVVRALAQVDSMLTGPVAAAEVARRVHLSLSQLERLFGAHVGLSVRRLVRWRRLRLALALAVDGHSLTHAAHAAGFADSAHFSRTMRAAFGVRADHTLRRLRLHLVG